MIKAAGLILLMPVTLILPWPADCHGSSALLPQAQLLTLPLRPEPYCHRPSSAALFCQGTMACAAVIVAQAGLVNVGKYQNFR